MLHNKNTKLYFWLFSILLSVLLIATSSAQVADKPTAVDSTALFLLSNSTGKVIPINATEWPLSIEKVCNIKKDDLAKQLQLLGISANSDAQSLVLHYNQLNSISDFKAGPDCYWFPAIKVSSGNNPPPGYLLVISAFPEAKQQLWDETAKLYQALDIEANSIVTLNNTSFTEPLLSLIKNHHAYMAAVDSSNVIMPLELINQASAEVNLLQTLYSNQIKDGKAPVSINDSSQVDSLVKSISARATAYRELFGFHVKVINRTRIPLTVNLLNDKGQAQGNYEVYIAPRALVNNKRFHQPMGVTSPAKGFVTAGNYTVWAVKFNESGSTVVSNYRELPVNDLSITNKDLNLLFKEVN
jgi:hypothetical protein